MSDTNIYDLAYKVYKIHRAAWEQWREGGIDEVWIDEDKHLCIRYESGKWWHYEIEGAHWVWW